jgi:hypothetical protein
MAGTYYKYAEREADSYVNWGEIGKNLSDMLQEQNKIREDKKAAIDKSSREFGEVLSNAPQGEQKQLNEWALQYAADAQEARLLQDRLLKSGSLKVRDYTVMRQNINDGTKQAFTLIKEYQDEYKTKMERLKAEKSQDLEGWLMQQAEGFGNFTKSKLYINPTNFKVSVAGTKKTIVNGKEVYVMDEDPNNFTTVNALRNRMKGTYDKYDVPGSVKAMVDNLGVEINSIERLGTLYKTGSITQTLDITKRKNLPADAQGVIMKFEEAETKMLEAQLQNPYNTSSILTNTLKFAPNGKQYTYTWSETERDANPNLILLKDSETGNPMPEFTPEQEKAALERLRLEARMQYDKKQEIRQTPQTQQQYAPSYVYERGDAANKAINAGNMLGKLYSGTAAEVQSASDYFYGLPNVRDFKRDANGITLVTTDGVKKEIPFKNADGSLKTKEDFIRSATSLLLGEGADVANVVKGSLGTTSNVFNDKASTESSAESNNPSVLYGKYVTESITDLPKIEEEAVPKLNPILSKIGFKAEEAVGGVDAIVLKSTKDKKIVSENIRLDDPEAINNIQGFLLANISGKDETEKALFLNSLMRIGVFDAQMAKPKPTPAPPTNTPVVNPNGVGSQYNK